MNERTLRSATFRICVTDLFRAAAEVGPHHILKMYNITGNTVNISPQLEANSVDSHYRLEVVTSDVKGERSHFSFMLVRFFENCGVFFVHIQV